MYKKLDGLHNSPSEGTIAEECNGRVILRNGDVNRPPRFDTVRLFSVGSRENLCL